MLLVIELGSDVMQTIVCNTKSILFVTVITIPCKTIRKKKNDNKKKVMQKFLEFLYDLRWDIISLFFGGYPEHPPGSRQIHFQNGFQANHPVISPLRYAMPIPEPGPFGVDTLPPPRSNEAHTWGVSRETIPKFDILVASEKWWLEDNPFLLGR